MPAKTTQQFIEQATLKHNGFYTYSKVDYKTSTTKVTIICPVHGDFDQEPNSHLQGHGCPKCCGNEKKTTQQFIKEATLKHNGFYDYQKSDYKNDRTKVIITCPVHGDFDQIPSSHLQGQGCFKCCGNEKKTTQQFIKEATLKHNRFYDYSKVDYKNALKKVTIICPIHGEFVQTPTGHLSGRGCLDCSGNKKKTTQQFIEEATIKHNGFYDYSKVDYKNALKKVTIICPIHGDYKQKPINHLQGQGCLDCSGNKKKTTQQFIEKATLKHNRFYDYSKVIYVNSETKVIIICPIHGEYEQTPNNHLHGYGCKSCRDDKLKKTTEQFIEQATLKHNGFYTYSRSKYERNDKSITITCPVHGDFEQAPIIHLRGHGCKSCDVDNRRKTTEQFVEDANKVHNNLYDYSKVDYKNKRTKVIIICFKHGEFKQTPTHHVLKGNGCPKCSNSISKSSQKWLDYLGIPNIMGETREIRIKLGNKAIVADGFDSQTNTIYEFHGDYWHGNPAIYDLNDINKVANKTFGELLQKTQKRSRLIKSHGYNLVSIWESDWEKINKQIDIEAAK